jgi:hypothetical protein
LAEANSFILLFRWLKPTAMILVVLENASDIKLYCHGLSQRLIAMSFPAFSQNCDIDTRIHINTKLWGNLHCRWLQPTDNKQHKFWL